MEGIKNAKKYKKGINVYKKTNIYKSTKHIKSITSVKESKNWINNNNFKKYQIFLLQIWYFLPKG